MLFGKLRSRRQAGFRRLFLYGKWLTTASGPFSSEWMRILGSRGPGLPLSGAGCRGVMASTAKSTASNAPPTSRKYPFESGNPGPRLPRIRIHSEVKGPEAVVIDTSGPTIVPPVTVQKEAAKASVPPAPQLAENVAQLVSSSQKLTAKELKAERKPQPHSKTARARSKRPPVSYAERPDLGPFDGGWTFGQQGARIRESFAQQNGARRELARAQTEHGRRFGWFDTGW